MDERRPTKEEEGMRGMEKRSSGETMSNEQESSSLAAALLDDPWNCVWREWNEGMRLVIMNRAERLGEEPAGHYILAEGATTLTLLRLKEIIPTYTEVLQFLEHAGVDACSGWHVSTEDPTMLPERVRRAVFALWKAPAVPVS